MSAEEDPTNVNDRNPHEIESLLSNLAPVRPHLERDRLMFLAGQDAAFRSPKRFVRFSWHALAATLALAAVSAVGWGVLARRAAEQAAWQASFLQGQLNAIARTRPVAMPGALPARSGVVFAPGAAPPLGIAEEQPLETWEQEALAAAERAEALRMAAVHSAWRLRASRTDGRGSSNTGYFQLRDQMLAFGVDAIPGDSIRGDARGGGAAGISSSYLDLLKGNVGNW